MKGRTHLLIAAATLVLLGSGLASWYVWYPRSPAGGGNVVRVNLPPASAIPTPEPLVFRDITPEQAEKANLEVPFAKVAIEVAPPFIEKTDLSMPLAERTATDCLTAAVYYEAGQESIQGQRAVAQVVLNRTRHPAYPRSICGVVYQGSERSTGCQFTFTCDGSLARQPNRTGWERARLIATQALHGYVEPSVGMATHYHANYVMPYWAPSLDKIAAIGAHLFYTWKGSWGRRAAFRQVPVAEDGTVPLIQPADILFEGGEELAGPSAAIAPYSPLAADKGPRLGSGPALTAPVSATPLVADEASGSLKIDDHAPALGADQQP